MMPSIGYSNYQFPWPEMEKPAKWKLSYGDDPAPACPRCASTNTKFCYYNNYSLSQPRYFCKGCRRYWTKGGSLRNVPFGGGCRKTRRRPNKDRRFDRSNMPANERNSPNPDEEFRVSPVSDGSEIDLAAVFAKFVNNQSPSSTENTATGFDQESPATTDVLDSWNWGAGQEADALYGFYEQFHLTQEIEDGGSGQLLGDDDQGAIEQGTFEFQGLLDDKDIQEFLNCSFPDNANQLDCPASFVFNDLRSSSDLPDFGI